MPSLDTGADVYRPDVPDGQRHTLVINNQGGTAAFRIDARKITKSPSNVQPGGLVGDQWASGRVAQGLEEWEVAGPFSVNQTDGTGSLRVTIKKNGSTLQRVKGSVDPSDKRTPTQKEQTPLEQQNIPDDRTTTQKEEKTRDAVRSTQARADDSSGGPGATRVGAQSFLFAAGAAIGLYLLSNK